MARRYQYGFQFFDSEAAAKAFCAECNCNPYIRRKHPAHYTPWSSSDGKEHKFVAWYYYQ